jgi:hypothetical protein
MFTQKEEGSPSIGVGSSTGWRVSANSRRNCVDSRRSSTWVGWVGEEPLQVVVSFVARRYMRRLFARAVVYGLDRFMKRGS